MSDATIDGRGVLLDTQFTGILPTASTVGVNGMASDLSLIGSLTGGAVETARLGGGANQFCGGQRQPRWCELGRGCSL